MENINQLKLFSHYRIQIKAQPITLHLKRSFNTAHSSSTTRTNFLIKTTLSHSLHSSQIQLNKSLPFSGYGQCGLPPKKPFCYLSDINDCQQFIKVIQQKLQSFHQNLLTQKIQGHQVRSMLQNYFIPGFSQYFDQKTQNMFAQNLAFFKRKYQEIIEKNKNNQGQLNPEIFFYLQVFFIINTSKEISHQYPQFKAPRNALQFSLLDLIGQIQKKPVSQLLYECKSQFKISQNFSFYTISHEQNLQSMLQNGLSSLQFTDCIKIKFNNQVQKLIELLKLMDEQNVGRRWIIDANASWSPKDYLRFQELFNQIASKNQSIRKKFLFVEQPFPIFKSLTSVKSQQQIEQQKNQWQKIKQKTNFVIVADESFATCDDLNQVIKYSHGINIKMEKCGGPFEALKILKQMQKNKINFLMFGSMVSTHLGCTQTFQFNQFAQYFDIDGALLVKQPQINGGFEWKGSQGIKKVEGNGLCISQQDLKELI